MDKDRVEGSAKEIIFARLPCPPGFFAPDARPRPWRGKARADGSQLGTGRELVRWNAYLLDSYLPKMSKLKLSFRTLPT